MRVLAVAVALVSTWLGASSPAALAASADCSRVGTAFDAWKRSSWEVERRMEVVLNDELKARLTDQVTSRQGQVSVRSIKREIFDPQIDLDNDEGDPAMQFEPQCDRTRALDGGRYTLASRDGFEQLTVRIDERDGQLVLEEWVRRQTVRMLWKKVSFFVRATYDAPRAPGAST